MASETLTFPTLADLIDARHPFEVPIVVAEIMSGSKRALWNGRECHISPAMHALLTDESPDEVEKLMRQIEVQILPAPDFRTLLSDSWEAKS